MWFCKYGSKSPPVMVHMMIENHLCPDQSSCANRRKFTLQSRTQAALHIANEIVNAGDSNGDRVSMEVRPIVSTKTKKSITT